MRVMANIIFTSRRKTVGEAQTLLLYLSSVILRGRRLPRGLRQLPRPQGPCREGFTQPCSSPGRRGGCEWSAGRYLASRGALQHLGWKQGRLHARLVPHTLFPLSSPTSALNVTNPELFFLTQNLRAKGSRGEGHDFGRRVTSKRGERHAARVGGE